MKLFGIDISRWQGNYDLAKAQTEGVQFVIIKAGGGDDGLYQDSKFESNYEKAEKLGLPKGAYFYGDAKSVADAEKEADKFLSIIKGKHFEYPVYYDVEGSMLNQNKTTLTKVVLAFLKKLENAGYFAGIYTSESTYKSRIDDSKIKAYAHWVANWSNEPKLSSGASVGIWQFGGESNCIRTTKVAGQTTDQNYCYVDYPAKIKAAGLNGYTTASTSQSKKESKNTDSNASTTTVNKTTVTHKVVKGDTTSALAIKYGTTISAIVNNNKSKYPNITADHIEVGWVLTM
jgi:LysM repeat protein